METNKEPSRGIAFERPLTDAERSELVGRTMRYILDVSDEHLIEVCDATFVYSWGENWPPPAEEILRHNGAHPSVVGYSRNQDGTIHRDPEDMGLFADRRRANRCHEQGGTLCPAQPLPHSPDATPPEHEEGEGDEGEERLSIAMPLPRDACADGCR